MASKYLVGSGSFTSTSIWSDSYNGVSGASVPVSGDVIYVDDNYNITSGLPSDDTFDFIVRLGANVSTGITLGLSGSPTFRLLDIRSANSAAHTVSFDDGATIILDKLVAIGESTQNRLILRNTSGQLGIMNSSYLEFNVYSTCYGENIEINAVSTAIYSSSLQPLYIGSSSIKNTGVWLLQDPPKISTLVDPLTADPASNPNWRVTGTTGGPGSGISKITTGNGGGGYLFGYGVAK